MMKRGQSEIDRAITDGRWQAAYASQSKAVPHADLQAALEQIPLDFRHSLRA